MSIELKAKTTLEVAQIWTKDKWVPLKEARKEQRRLATHLCDLAALCTEKDNQIAAANEILDEPASEDGWREGQIKRLRSVLEIPRKEPEVKTNDT
jgi:hypothetical protein